MGVHDSDRITKYPSVRKVSQGQVDSKRDNTGYSPCSRRTSLVPNLIHGLSLLTPSWFNIYKKKTILSDVQLRKDNFIKSFCTWFEKLHINILNGRLLIIE